MFQSSSEEEEEELDCWDSDYCCFDDDNSSLNILGSYFKYTFGSFYILLYLMPNTLPVIIPPTIIANKINEQMPKLSKNYPIALIYRWN